jgi:hypothetical protein
MRSVWVHYWEGGDDMDMLLVPKIELVQGGGEVPLNSKTPNIHKANPFSPKTTETALALKPTLHPIKKSNSYNICMWDLNEYI